MARAFVRVRRTQRNCAAPFPPPHVQTDEACLLVNDRCTDAFVIAFSSYKVAIDMQVAGGVR